MKQAIKNGKPITTLIQAVMKMSKKELRKFVLDLILGNIEKENEK